MENKTFYRVCHEKTQQGLWYNFDGEFTGLIHNDFNFCTHNQLAMDFDPEVQGWLSVADTLEGLHVWFPKEEIIKLQEHGWYLHEYQSISFKFYDKFQHWLINQNEILKITKIEL